MKTIRVCLFALFVALAVPVSAAPIAIGEFAFNLDEFFPDFFQFFSIASNLAADDPLAWTTIRTVEVAFEVVPVVDALGEFGPREKETIHPTKRYSP